MTPSEVAIERVLEPLDDEQILWTEPLKLGRLIGTKGTVANRTVGRILVVESPFRMDIDDILAGLVWVKESGVASVRHIWVNPDYRQLGIAKGLIDAYERHVFETEL